MKYYKTTLNGYIIYISTNGGAVGITETEYNTILAIIRSKPTAPESFVYRLREDLEWELYELPALEEETPLEAMTTAELKTIMADKGIATTMTKDNMVTLIKATE